MADVLKKVADFQTDVLSVPGLTVVDFWAEWCGPCKRLTPILESVARDLNTIHFFKVDINEHPEIATKYGIVSIPTLLLFKDGRLEKTQTGFMSRPDLISWLTNV